MSIFAALDSLAQQVEHNTFNVGVLGSSPRRITEKKSALQFCKAGFVFEVWGITLSPYFLRLIFPFYIFFPFPFSLANTFQSSTKFSKCSNNVLLQKGNPWPPFL